MNNRECPKCHRTKYRIIKRLCQSCYSIEFNRCKFVRKLSDPKTIVLSDFQKEFLTGSLLGDGWITNLKYGRKNPAFGVDRKQDDLGYLKWQFNCVKNLCSRSFVLKDKYNKITNKIQKHCLFETRFLSCLLELRKLWYPNNVKIVPSSLTLTRLVIQIWYCDDGSLEVFESGSFRIKFATNGFSKDEVIFLADLLKDRYCADFSIHKDGSNFRIVASSKTAPILMKDLANDHPPLSRKFII